jgi:hypothetical protein
LPGQWQKKVLENELRITGLLVGVLARLSQSGELPHRDEQSIELTAHNIVVMGHMWTFRRWFLGKHYSIEDYIKLQTAAVLRMCTGGPDKRRVMRTDRLAVTTIQPGQAGAKL